VKYLDVDEQTRTDLAIFSAAGKNSIYDLYNQAITRGGQLKLEELFKLPMAEAQAINERSAVYKFFKGVALKFPLDSETVGTLEYYLQNQDARTQLQAGAESVSQRLKDMIAVDQDQRFVITGVQAALTLFNRLSQFLTDTKQYFSGSPYQEQYNALVELINGSEFRLVHANMNSKRDARLPVHVMAELDRQIRFEHGEKIITLLNQVFELDVYMAIGKVALERNFSFAIAELQDAHTLTFEKVYHPLIENAVVNDFGLDHDKNVLFLTGANMAGKSTLMKSIGVALYLAHMGFPVAAQKLKFSVRDGLYTSINLSDNLSSGASHFYAEVLRVKTVATELQAGRKLLVIFDELFRGTNVKDACDGTIELATAFSRKKDSWFIISTHIMEAGESLQQSVTGLTYQYLPTELKGTVPHYPRILRDGITADRQGMVIIKNEGILDMLDAGIKQKNG
jgi:DNA mismatch repair protein MutS